MCRSVSSPQSRTDFRIAAVPRGAIHVCLSERKSEIFTCSSVSRLRIQLLCMRLCVLLGRRGWLLTRLACTQVGLKVLHSSISVSSRCLSLSLVLCFCVYRERLGHACVWVLLVSMLFQSSASESGTTASIVILDRSIDVATLLVHEYTYQVACEHAPPNQHPDAPVDSLGLQRSS